MAGGPCGYTGMTLEEIAEVRPRLLDFTAEMLGGLARKDQWAAGELYVRGLLGGGQRKSMVPMAERLGIDHQRLQIVLALILGACPLCCQPMNPARLTAALTPT